MPPHPFVRGGGHTRLQLKGWGSPNSNEGTYTVVLYIYKYFVIRKLFVDKQRWKHVHRDKTKYRTPLHSFFHTEALCERCMVLNYFHSFPYFDSPLFLSYTTSKVLLHNGGFCNGCITKRILLLPAFQS